MFASVVELFTLWLVHPFPQFFTLSGWFAKHDRQKLLMPGIHLTCAFGTVFGGLMQSSAFSGTLKDTSSTSSLIIPQLRLGCGGVCYDKTLRWLERRSVHPIGLHLILPDTCLGFASDWFGQYYSLREIAARLLVSTTRALSLGIAELLMHSPP